MAILSRSAMSCELVSNLKTIAIAHDYAVRVLSPIVRVEYAWNAHIYHQTLYDGKNGIRTLFSSPVWSLQLRGTAREHYGVM